MFLVSWTLTISCLALARTGGGFPEQFTHLATFFVVFVVSGMFWYTTDDIYHLFLHLSLRFSSKCD